MDAAQFDLSTKRLLPREPQLASFPNPKRWSLNIVHVDGMLYAIDCHAFKCLDTSVPNAEWISLSPMKTRRVEFGLTVVTRRIYIWGGEGYTRCTRSINTGEVYDIDSATWSALPSMRQPRSHPKGIIALIGGCCRGREPNRSLALSTIEMFDIRTNSRLGSIDTNPSLLTPRVECSATVVGGTLYVVGGCGERSCEKSIEILNVADLFSGLKP